MSETDMTAERKSSWTRPWRGWRAVVGLFGILFAAALLALLVVEWASNQTSLMKGNMVVQALILAAAVTLVVTMGVVFIGWICSWRNLRRFLFGVACFATVIALFYAEETIRGRWAWNRYVREQAARGEVFDLLQLAPLPISDEKNFFMAPLWDSIRFTVTNGKPVWQGQGPGFIDFSPSGPRRRDPTPRLLGWQAGERSDLAGWQAIYRGSNNIDSSEDGAFTNYFPVRPEPQSPAEDVLFALSRFDDNRQLLIEACSRPDARFWVNYEDGYAALLPHLAPLKSATRYLSLHAVAASQAGDGDTAFEDVAISLRLIESVRDEPILISHLVRNAMLEITMQAVWEGLADSCWSEAQLAAIEAELKQLDFLADYRLAMRGERAFCIWNVDYVEEDRRAGARKILSMVECETYVDTFGSALTVVLIRLAPEGWFDQNKISLCETIDDYFLPMADVDRHLVDPAVTKTAMDNLEHLYANWALRDFATRELLFAMTGLVQKFAVAQSTADLARVAIALERYRLDTGKFPESLDSLVPGFIADLPHDVINGEPLHYRRTADGQFVLYSVGWNETDDGGEVALSRSAETVDRNEGDWVWRYPEK